MTSVAGALMGKIAYLVRSVAATANRERHRCPNCGSQDSRLVERKYVVTMLRRCDACLLMFRAPTDAPDHGDVFYNEDYTQGFTTDLPSPEALQALIDSRFAGSEKDYSRYIRLLHDAGVQPGARVFDFGCSWGYGSHQFAQAGFDTLSYELSRERGRYGAEKLGVRLVDDFDAWANTAEAEGSHDVFFSSHVLEHVPSPGSVLRLARRVVKPGGLIVTLTPNGSLAAKVHPRWSNQWGDVHPNFLDDVYWNHALQDCPRILGSSPVTLDAAAKATLDGSEPETRSVNDLSGSELCCIARTPGR